MARMTKVLGLLASCAMALACGDEATVPEDGGSTGAGDGGSTGAGDGGTAGSAGDGGTTGSADGGSGDGGTTGSADGGSGDGGTTGDGGTGSTADAGADGSGGDASDDAGSDGATDGSTEEAATPECSGSERRCDGEQPQECSGDMWQDDGEACTYLEPCATATGTCEVASIEVPGGTFHRSYDAVDDGFYNDMTKPATVSSLRVDTYEVTVGQFRRFVDDWLDGWTPAAGAGKHAHLNSGAGLVNTGASSTHEGGWDTAWNVELPTTAEDWDDALDCHPDHHSFLHTWTPTAGANEDKAINCANWYDAYAYCIWSGGFLMSEAERNYVAAGGDEQRRFPWGNAAPAANLLVYNTTSPANVGSKPAGNGRWGHADLSGNVNEWTLDYHVDPYPMPCTDCAQLDPGPETIPPRVSRGGDFFTSGWGLLSTGNRSHKDPAWRTLGGGIRCARAPG